MHRLTTAIALILALLGIAFFVISCEGEIGGNNREDAIRVRNKVFDRAESVAPAYEPVNFPARRALNEYTKRQDRLNQLYYVYILGENGSVINYFVSKTLPVNVCAFLSSTEDVRDDNEGGNLVLTAPSLDGIFYGGAGSSAACVGWIIFDELTDAMLVVSGPGSIISDAPLKLDLKPIEVEIVSSGDN